MPSKASCAAVAALLVACHSTAARAQFSEFDHPTVDFDKQHVLPTGTTLCRDRERDMSGDRGRCYRLRRPAKVWVRFVVHGYTKPEFWVEPIDPALAHAWVYRDDISD